MMVRTVSFEIPDEVEPGSEIEKLHILWELVKPCDAKQARRMLSWARDRHLSERRKAAQQKVKP